MRYSHPDSGRGRARPHDTGGLGRYGVRCGRQRRHPGPWHGGPLTVAAVEAIHTGDAGALRRLLAEQPRLATARLGDCGGRPDGGMSRTLLHVVTDWPGHYPNGVATVADQVHNPDAW
ncbi:hypothetical protein DMB66_41745 [Actinoplanes sp. ATCC 53533]|uniref:hypothetical protein n=1 Tax=Actinoplanes sp. ATCC 53533 TaxID=1288362 RepID=UPI000F775B6A|nr:hypothetical protein [Actinoplanes sp. ATCC 53533]RSM51489.1 hypothetical protein DMB66_41745 [Actinoplanes sp. ATCC 53533]